METNYEKIFGYEPIRKASRFNISGKLRDTSECTLPVSKIMKSFNYERIYGRDPVQKHSRLINY